MFKSLSKTAAKLSIGAIIGFLGLTAWNWYHPPKRGIAYRVTQTGPYDASEERFSRRLDKVVTTLPVQHIAPLTPKQREGIEDKVGGELPNSPGAVLLSFDKIKPLPAGGTALVYLTESTNGEFRPSLRIYPSKPSFFEFTPERRLGVWYGKGFGQLGGSVVQVEFEQSLFRVGPVQFSGRAGVLSSAAATDGYVLVGGSVTF